jgi:alkanesulfonate monooxygenase SsuD/methylene tetrahydromethanopterin reductase-like flavin-dependent oxidoreductase (luciferase family)
VFSVDQLSNGRLVLGIVSGDRLIGYPTSGIDFEIRDVRFRIALNDFCRLTESFPKYHSQFGF